MKRTLAMAQGLARALAIVALVMIGATILVRFAPGYFSDVRELDARYANTERAQLAQEAERSKALTPLLVREIAGWLHGDAGVSRQFGVPVLDLLRPRIAVTGGLLVRAVVLAWALALTASFVALGTRHSQSIWHVPANILLAIPTAAMAMVCLFLNWGGAVTVMALLLAARDFKFLHRSLRKTWSEPWLLQARAQGIRFRRLVIAHVLPAMVTQLAALASLSIVTALSALVPVEVIFDVPGLGKLAWNAALNRDLPVLLAVTLLMALAVALSGYTPTDRSELERA
jgi:peptide/nickel transport system permease protein